MNSPDCNIHVLGTHALSQSYRKKLLEGRDLGLVTANQIECVENPCDFIWDHYRSKKSPHDIFIPDHTAKHVMLEVMMLAAREQGAQNSTLGNVILSPIVSDVSTPFIYKSDGGAIWAMSFATWSCPPTCTEPAICPFIESKRHWEMKEIMKSLGAHFVFSCELVYCEIAGIQLGFVHQQLSRLENLLLQSRPLEVVVATHSNCHGIAGKFIVTSQK